MSRGFCFLGIFGVKYTQLLPHVFMRESGRGTIIDFPKNPIETSEVGVVGIETKISSAQIGNKGLFYFGDRFGFSGDRGRLCHVPAKYAKCELFGLGNGYAVIIDPENKVKKAVLKIPDDLWAKNEGKSYYSFLENDDVWNIEGEKLEKYKNADWYQALTEFGYVSKDERRVLRAEQRDEKKKLKY